MIFYLSKGQKVAWFLVKDGYEQLKYIYFKL